MKKGFISGSLAMSLIAAGSAFGVTAYDESVSGDLSDVGSAPTPVVFVVGDNDIIGEVGPSATDLSDYWTVTIAPGQMLTATLLDFYDPDLPGNSGNTSSLFEADTGSTFAGSGANDLGDTIITAGLVGSDVLPSGPLGPGSYTFRMGEGGGPAGYTLGFQVVIPEPTTAALLAVAPMLMSRIRRR